MEGWMEGGREGDTVIVCVSSKKKEKTERTREEEGRIRERRGIKPRREETYRETGEIAALHPDPGSARTAPHTIHLDGRFCYIKCFMHRSRATSPLSQQRGQVRKQNSFVSSQPSSSYLKPRPAFSLSHTMLLRILCRSQTGSSARC